MRHDVGEVVAAARLQVDIVDRVGQVGGRGDVVAGELEATGRRFDPPGEQQGVGPVADRGGVAGRIEGGQDPLRASAVAEDDPGPAEPVDEAERDERVVGDAPGQRGVDVGALGPGEGEMLGLVTAAHTLCGGSGGVGEPCGVGGEGALGQSGVGHRFEREGADAVEQPVADGGRRIVRRRRSPANGWRAGRPRRSPRLRVHRALRGRTRPRGGVRRQRRWPGPTGPAGRRGTAGRSSIGSST